MDVIAFVGPSGTGKSHRALMVAHTHHAQCLIDDGILIHNNRIVAGVSAKKESSRLKAVRRAIFEDPEQVRSVKEALERIQPERLMILGTSQNMVNKITKALDIASPSQYISIFDVATEREIEKAQHARLKEGKHIIPVPTVELKPHFKGYLIDPLKSIWRFAKGNRNEDVWEKSVIRPAFSYHGRLTFEDDALEALVKNTISRSAGLGGVKSITIKKSAQVNNGIQLSMDVIVVLGHVVKEVMSQLHKDLKHEFEYITGMSLEKVSIQVAGTVEPSKVKYKK